MNSEHDLSPEMLPELWTFAVTIKAAGFQHSTKLRGDALASHYSIRLEGYVGRGQSLIERTSVYASIWAAGEDWGDMIRAERSIGRARISKDVAKIRSFSVTSSKPLAGIEIDVRLPESAVRQLWDTLSNADLERVSMEFGCVGTHVSRSGQFSKPELILSDDDVEVKVISFTVDTGLGEFSDIELDELE